MDNRVPTNGMHPIGLPEFPDSKQVEELNEFSPLSKVEMPKTKELVQELGAEGIKNKSEDPKDSLNKVQETTEKLIQEEGNPTNKNPVSWVINRLLGR